MKSPEFTSRDVQKLAQLSKLALSEVELISFTKELNSIVHYVEKLEEVDTSDIPPTLQECFFPQPPRKDQIEVTTSSEKILSVAPETDQHYFLVPKVIET